jgi:Tfp pilus assembly protein PilF
MIWRMRFLALLPVLLLAACSLQGTARPPVSAVPEPGEPGTAQPQAVPGQPGQPVRPAPREFTLGPAATALVAQAHRQSGGGDYAQAAATLERAVRIEPDNPLVWIELGRVRLGENNGAQADAMGRKALALATGDPQAQSSAWHLIADGLRARGRNGEAVEAERHALGLAPR